MSRYRTSFTSDGSMLVVVVDREQGGPVARFSWDPEDTDGALGELAAALAAMGQLPARREHCRVVKVTGRRRPRADKPDEASDG